MWLKSFLGFLVIHFSVYQYIQAAIIITWGFPKDGFLFSSFISAFFFLECYKKEQLFLPCLFIQSMLICTHVLHFGDGPRMLTECLAVYPYYILRHRTHVCQYDVKSAVEIKDLRTETSENFPSGGKSLVKGMKHCYGGKD